MRSIWKTLVFGKISSLRLDSIIAAAFCFSAWCVLIVQHSKMPYSVAWDCSSRTFTSPSPFVMLLLLSLSYFPYLAAAAAAATPALCTLCPTVLTSPTTRPSWHPCASLAGIVYFAQQQQQQHQQVRRVDIHLGSCARHCLHHCDSMCTCSTRPGL